MAQGPKYTAGPPAGLMRQTADAQENAVIDEQIAEIEADPEMPEWKKKMVKSQLRLKKARIKSRAASSAMSEMTDAR